MSLRDYANLWTGVSCHHTEKFGKWIFESGYMFLYCHVTSHDHMLKGLKPLMVTYHLAMLVAIGRVQVEI